MKQNSKQRIAPRSSCTWCKSISKASAPRFVSTKTTQRPSFGKWSLMTWPMAPSDGKKQKSPKKHSCTQFFAYQTSFHRQVWPFVNCMVGSVQHFFHFFSNHPSVRMVSISTWPSLSHALFLPGLAHWKSTRGQWAMPGLQCVFDQSAAKTSRNLESKKKWKHKHQSQKISQCRS